jgi:hypothetical protein
LRKFVKIKVLGLRGIAGERASAALWGPSSLGEPGDGTAHLITVTDLNEDVIAACAPFEGHAGLKFNEEFEDLTAAVG